jgi:hypothetical protein
MASSSPALSGVEHCLSLLPDMEERWRMDLSATHNVRAHPQESRPIGLSVRSNHGRPISQDNRTRRHPRLRGIQTCERTQTVSGGAKGSQFRRRKREPTVAASSARHTSTAAGCADSQRAERDCWLPRRRQHIADPPAPSAGTGELENQS